MQTKILLDSNGQDLAIEHLRQWLHYDPATGIFVWKECLSNVAPVGTRAGTPGERGYWCIQIKGQRYRANRLAWFYVNGVWPRDQIDHVNGVTSDDRILNLRNATGSQNQANAAKRKDNASGHKGVSYHKLTGKWSAAIQHRCKRVHIGLFETASDAAAAYIKTSKKLHGEFARAA